MDKFITKNYKETKELGLKFAMILKPGQSVFLYGDLGAGKTTFVQGVSEGLGIKDRIISPTFVLHRIHKTNSRKVKLINHIDLYRIEDKLDIKDLGLSDIFEENDSVAFIEWADRIDNLPAVEGYKIFFKHLGENKREIVIQKILPEIQKAVEVLRNGGVVIYPTDTAFGIGCRIDNKESIERLFKIRKRPENKAVPVLFDSIEKVKEYVMPFDKKVEKLMKDNWPGALTIVLKCKENKVLSLVRGGQNTLGVRIPDHEIPLSLIQGLGVPIIGTSANFAGEKTPFRLDQLDKRLVKLVDFVLEGETKGEGLSSTVVDCSKNPWNILRQGSVVI